MILIPSLSWCGVESLVFGSLKSLKEPEYPMSLSPILSQFLSSCYEGANGNTVWSSFLRFTTVSMTFCVAVTIYPMTIYGASYLVYGFRGVSPCSREDLAEQGTKKKKKLWNCGCNLYPIPYHVFISTQEMHVLIPLEHALWIRSYLNIWLSYKHFWNGLLTDPLLIFNIFCCQRDHGPHDFSPLVLAEPASLFLPSPSPLLLSPLYLIPVPLSLPLSLLPLTQDWTQGLVYAREALNQWFTSPAEPCILIRQVIVSCVLAKNSLEFFLQCCLHIN